MSDQIEILKSDNEPPILSQPKRKVRQPKQGWADAKDEIAQELSDPKLSILSPGQSSATGEV